MFVTAYDQHAVAAFDQGAVDYVLKPVSRGAALHGGVAPEAAPRHAAGAAGCDAERARRAAPRRRRPRQYLRWINASVGQNVKLITVDEISYFQADNKYTRVVTAEGEALIRKPLKELVEELDPNQFWQIHRSTLVNAIVDCRRHARLPRADAGEAEVASRNAAGLRQLHAPLPPDVTPRQAAGVGIADIVPI